MELCLYIAFLIQQRNAACDLFDIIFRIFNFRLSRRFHAKPLLCGSFHRLCHVTVSTHKNLFRDLIYAVYPTDCLHDQYSIGRNCGLVLLNEDQLTPDGYEVQQKYVVDQDAYSLI